MTTSEMYTEMIIDYSQNPKNFGKIENAVILFKDVNPSCGDVIEISASLEKETIKDIKFSGSGCAISMAAAELLTENLKGKKIEEGKILNKEDIFKMLGIELSPLRIKCALLCLKTFKCGLYNYMGEKLNDE